MRTSHKILETITSKNIVNDGQIQIIASEAMVTFVQKISVSHRLKKRPSTSHRHKKFTIVQVYLYSEYMCLRELTFTNPYLSTQLLDSLQYIHPFN